VKEGPGGRTEGELQQVGEKQPGMQLAADASVGNKTAIAVGKYITRRTYVELITDGQGYSATRIEFAITRWLSLLSTISTVGRQSASVRVSKDY
jgi:translocation and assembly module TamB